MSCFKTKKHKFDFGWGSAPDPLRELTALPRLPSWWGGGLAVAAPSPRTSPRSRPCGPRFSRLDARRSGSYLFTIRTLPLNRVQQRLRRQTIDGFAMTYDERRLRSSGVAFCPQGRERGDGVLGDSGSDPHLPQLGSLVYVVSSPRAFKGRETRTCINDPNTKLFGHQSQHSAREDGPQLKHLT